MAILKKILLLQFLKKIKKELNKPQKLNLLIDIQEKLINKGAAYER